VSVTNKGDKLRGKKRRSELGVAIVEFALVGTVFLVLVLGIIDFARMFQGWITVQHAAREGARYALTGRSDCDIAGDNRLVCIEYQAKKATTGLAGAPDDVDISVRSWQYPNYAEPPTQGSGGNACDAIEVQVDYDFQMVTPFLSALIGHVPLRGSDRVLNEPFGSCE
jgi:hypothetical protein